MDKRKEIITGDVCPYCEKPSVLTGADVIYGKRGIKWGYIFLCRKCDAYVGCHKGTCKAKGRLANKELREWKKIAHSYFDPLWKTTGKRESAYKWLSKEMGLKRQHTHIGMFDIDECRKVVELCAPYFKN